MEFQDSRSDRNNRILDRNFTSQGTSFETAAKMRDNNPTTENLIKQAYFQNDKGAASVIPEISLLETQEIPDKLELARLDSPSRNLEPSSGVQGSSAFSSQQAKSDQVRQIMVQIFQGTAPKEGETIQIRLTPEELGTVTYRLSTSEAGPVIHVISDRAETLDLLRRNTDQLLAEFAEFGFSDADVTFSDDMSSNSPTGTDDSEADGVAPGLAQGSNPTIAYKLNVAHGVDIRI